MRTYKRTAALAALLLPVTVLAACGSSSDTSAGDAAGANGGSSSNTIKVGMICSCSGSQSSSLGRSGDVAKAWASSVNAAGGINGSQVQMIVKDDGADAAKGLQAAKELASDGVIAIVGDMSVVDASWASYIEQAGIPVVGGESLFPPFATSSDFFPTGGTLGVELYTSMAVGKEAGATNMAFLYCAESPICANMEGPAQKYATSLGMKLTPAKVSATAPDYTAVCLQMKNSGADAMTIQDDGNIAQRIVDSCAAQGYQPRVVANTGSSTITWLKDKNYEGASVTSVNANYTDQSVPGIKRFTDAMNKYVPGLTTSDQFAYSLTWEWAAGELFEAAAKAGDVTATSSTEDVLDGLYALKDETLGGIAPPLNYTKGEATIIPCYFDITIKDGKYVSEGGYKCLDETEQKAFTDAGVF
ncbi:MAG: ABC transporter substrate-binding protein [Nocardioides sp.]|uniref:ABC transporter substrate-binding protein n=1 Tax=Nocardioides sp. TaxID=35761 RepID=UPI0039E5D357